MSGPDANPDSADQGAHRDPHRTVPSESAPGCEFPFVVDFGLALREAEVGQGPRFAGTPAYMSPEQARGEGHRVDGRSDVYSLGCVFYELLVGRRPFTPPSQAELFQLIVHQDPKPPRQINDKIPRELERICLKALAKRATDRYTTARDMADDLEHFLADHPPAGVESAVGAAPPSRALSSSLARHDSSLNDSERRLMRVVPTSLTLGDQHMMGRARIWTAVAHVGSLLIIAGLVSACSAPILGQDLFAGSEVLWTVKLGDHQYTVPRVDDDRIFIGTNDTNIDHPAAKSTGGGILMCFDRVSGTRVWQLPIPRYMPGINPPFHFDQWTCGICSSPAIDGNRLYVVSPRGDVLCIDREGQANGNDGPLVDEKTSMGIAADSDYNLAPTDGDIVWRFGMIEQLGVVPHDVCGSSPAMCGDYLYACTSNGVDDTHLHIPNPQAPSLIALDKHTGRLAATDGAIAGDRILHGTWSSPVVAEFADQTLVLYGGGDGILRAYRPLTTVPREGPAETLEVVWQYDCCPSDYRVRDGQPITYARWNKVSSDGPSEIISTPVVHNGRIYVAIGQSPIHGPGQGALSCIDGATGARVWESRQVNRTITDAVVHEGLVFIADYTGLLHCLDADTGEHYWQHDLIGGVWCDSPVVANGLVYIANEKNRMWVFRASREKTIVAQGRARSTPITPVWHDGILYYPTQHDLSAIRLRTDEAGAAK